MMPFVPGTFDGCMNAIGGKGCHVIGINYLFDEASNQNLNISDEEKAFGQLYRKTYTDLMKNKSSDVLASAYGSSWTKFTIENGAEIIGRPMVAQCALLTAMDAYGKF